MIQLIPSDHVVDQIVDRPVTQIRKPNVEVAKAIPQERLQQRTVEQIDDVPVPGNNQPGVQIQMFKVEQTIEAPIPQIQEHCVEATKAILQERLQLRTEEQIVDASVPQDGKVTVAETDAEGPARRPHPGVGERGCSDEGQQSPE